MIPPVLNSAVFPLYLLFRTVHSAQNDARIFPQQEICPPPGLLAQPAVGNQDPVKPASAYCRMLRARHCLFQCGSIPRNGNRSSRSPLHLQLHQNRLRQIPVWIGAFVG